MSAARMSVVLATDRYVTIERVLTSLRAQTIWDQLEVVIVSLSGAQLEIDPDRLGGFAAVRLVEPGRVLSLSAARAVGVRDSTAPVVQIGETHAFPHADWAEKVLEAHGEGWEAVVPAFRNANPESAISWSNLIADYGPWLDGMPAGEIDRVPPYNTTFTRSLALGLLGRSGDAFAAGYDLGGALRVEQHRIRFEPAAKLDHVNVSVARVWLTQRFWAARAHAAVRSSRWPAGRRIVYACGSPLLPLLLLGRLVGPVRTARRAHRLPRLTLPALILGSVASALGELAAFISGAGRRGTDLADEYELHKIRYTGMLDG